MTRDRLIIFTRYPVPGKAKTRLIPALGTEGAAQLHSRMAEHTLTQARQLQNDYPVDLEVRFTGGEIAQMQTWLGTDLAFQPQGEGNLGDRLMQAIQSAFNQGARSVIVIGTDCPELSTQLLEQAFHDLQHTDLVLGPAVDGGYYLIGLRRLIPELFQDIAWSTAVVRQQTVTAATALGLAIAQLPTLTDVDYPADLAALSAMNDWKQPGDSKAGNGETLGSQPSPTA